MSSTGKRKSRGSHPPKPSGCLRRQKRLKGGTTASKSWAKARLVKNPLGGQILFVEGRWDGEIPTKVAKQYNGRHVWIDRGCKAWRRHMAATLLDAVRKMRKKGVRATRLLHAVFDIWSTRARPDLDTAYHQVQDALTKDMWGLGDERVVGFEASRTKPPEGAGPMFFVEAWYEIE